MGRTLAPLFFPKPGDIASEPLAVWTVGTEFYVATLQSGTIKAGPFATRAEAEAAL